MAEKSLFGLDNFLNVVRTKHIPRTERFEVTFNLPKELGISNKNDTLRLLTVMCEEAQIPGFVTTTIPVKIGPWTEYRTQNLEFLTSDIVFTFIVEENWQARTLFEKWIQHCVNPISKEVKFHDQMYSDVEIKSLDTENNVLAKWKIYEAIPKLINLTPLAWGNIGFMRMSVAMSAKYWERTL